MFDLDKHVFWQNHNFQGLDKITLFAMFSDEFYSPNCENWKELVRHFFYENVSVKEGYNCFDEHNVKFEYPFLTRFMEVGLTFFADEIEAALNAFDKYYQPSGLSSDFNDILKLQEERLRQEEAIKQEIIRNLFGTEILSGIQHIILSEYKILSDNLSVDFSDKVMLAESNSRKVLLKTNRIWHRSDIDKLKSFIAAKVKFPEHKNLIKVYDVGLDTRKIASGRYEYSYFYSTEAADNLYHNDVYYCPRTLQQILDAGEELTSFQVIYLLKELLNGIKAIHESGLSHGNIRPENVLFIDGIPKLSEINSFPEGKEQINKTITVNDLGNQLKYDDCSQLNDLYALGICAYAALTGLPPAKFPETPFSLLKSEEGRKLNALILKACSSDLKQRFHDAEEFIQTIKDFPSETIPDIKVVPEMKPPEPINIFEDRLGKEIIDSLDDVKLSDYTVCKDFRGSGALGDVSIVYRENANGTTDYYALKRVNLNNPNAIQEVNSILLYKNRNIESPFLIPIFNVGCGSEMIDNQQEYFFFYVMELADNLFRICHIDYKKYHPISLEAVKYKNTEYPVLDDDDFRKTFHTPWMLFMSIIKGLKDLHDHNLVHRDIKPDNLIFINGKLVLSDMGLVAEIDELDNLAGTEGYLPPELLAQKFMLAETLQKQAVSNDLYAAGATIYNILYGEDVSLSRLDHDIEEYTKSDNKEPGIGDKPISDLLEIIKKCCAVNPTDRFKSADEIIDLFPEEKLYEISTHYFARLEDEDAYGLEIKKEQFKRDMEKESQYPSIKAHNFKRSINR